MNNTKNINMDKVIDDLKNSLGKMSQSDDIKPEVVELWYPGTDVC